jgi:Clustered mitochondria/Hom_end-associated Hint/Translation initiation factor eIF3 subunit 135/Leucine Rich repeat
MSEGKIFGDSTSLRQARGLSSYDDDFDSAYTSDTHVYGGGYDFESSEEEEKEEEEEEEEGKKSSVSNENGYLSPPTNSVSSCSSSSDGDGIISPYCTDDDDDDENESKSRRKRRARVQSASSFGQDMQSPYGCFAEQQATQYRQNVDGQHADDQRDDDSSYFGGAYNQHGVESSSYYDRTYGKQKSYRFSDDEGDDDADDHDDDDDDDDECFVDVGNALKDGHGYGDKAYKSSVYDGDESLTSSYEELATPARSTGAAGDDESDGAPVTPPPTPQRADVAVVEPASPMPERGLTVGWNKIFQRLLEMPETDEQQRLKKYVGLSALAADFVHTAKQCMNPDTLVMMASGKLRPIGDVAVGDRLMGDDGDARTASRVVRGHAPMYRVSYGASSAFECNGAHRLVVQVAARAHRIGSRETLGARLAYDDELGFDVPLPARIAGVKRSRAMLWQPTVEQYMRFACKYPRRAASMCTQMRVAVDIAERAARVCTISASIAEHRKCAANDERRSLLEAAERAAWLLGSRLVATGTGAPLSEDAMLSVLVDTELVRAAFVAGVVDEAGCLELVDNGRWRWRVELGGGAQRHSIAALACRAALSIGYDASVDKLACVRIAAPPADDIVCAALRCAAKRVPPSDDAMCADRVCARGEQRYAFAVQRIGDGPYVGVQVRGANHRFLLADCTVVHNCGKTIITEYFLPVRLKTIPPASVGGEAGGEKVCCARAKERDGQIQLTNEAAVLQFIWHNIIYKFASDWLHIYRSDEFAQKAAGHELKSLMRYYRVCEGLRVPLIALIDYRGYRLVAESVLPLTSSTILYGSNDGGRTVLREDPKLNAMMAAAAARLNLAEHKCGRRGSGRRVKLHAPLDIEAHRGLDGHYYAIDFARVFPPTAEEDVRNTFLYKLLRPEFVKAYPKPLSSDAFSPFGDTSPSAPSNADVREATEQLLSVHVPRFAAWLESGHDVDHDTVESQLTELAHREGINVRYIGLVRKHVEADEALRSILLTEMCARVIKNILRQRLREKSRNVNTLAQDSFRKVVINFLNMVLGHDAEGGRIARSFWRVEMKRQLTARFRGSLSLKERLEAHDLRAQIRISSLFRRLQHLSGIKIAKRALVELERAPDAFKIVLPDIKKISARVKHMNIISLAEGNALSIESMHSGTDGERLFRLAMRKFETSIRATPDNEATLNNYGDELVRHAQVNSSPLVAFEFLSKAFEKYKMAGNLERIAYLGEILDGMHDQYWQEPDLLIDLAVKCYEQITGGAANASLSSSSAAAAAVAHRNQSAGSLSAREAASRAHHIAEGFYRWGNVLIRKAYHWRSNDTYGAAGARYRRAIELCKRAVDDHRRQNSSEGDKESESSSSGGDDDEDDDDDDKDVLPQGLLDMARNSWALSLGDIELAVLLECSVCCADLDEFDSDWCYAKRLVGEPLLRQLTVHKSLIRLALRDCASLTSRALTRLCRNAPTLREVDFSGCASNVTDGVVIAACRACDALESLRLANCAALTDGAIAAIAKLGALHTLDIGGCVSITHAAIDELVCGCPRIVELGLAQLESVSPSTVKRIAINFPELRRLDISRCANVDDDALAHLGAWCAKLTHLSVAGCLQLSDRGILHLCAPPAGNDGGGGGGDNKEQQGDGDVAAAAADVDSADAKRTRKASAGLPRLRVLDVSECAHVGDCAIRALAKSAASASLRRLALFGCERLTDKSVTEVARRCTELRELELSRCFRLTDRSLQAMATHLRHLHTLRAYGCFALTDASLLALASAELRPLATSAPLRTLALGATTLLTDAGVMALAQRCTSLTMLDLSASKLLTEDGLAAIGDNLHSLVELRLSSCQMITDPGLQAVSSGCHKLRIVDLSLCQCISAIEFLAPECPLLESIDLHGCRNISDGAVLAIARLPSLRYLNIEGCRRVTNTAADSIDEHALALETLVIGSNKISHDRIARLTENERNICVRKSSSSSPSRDASGRSYRFNMFASSSSSAPASSSSSLSCATAATATPSPVSFLSRCASSQTSRRRHALDGALARSQGIPVDSSDDEESFRSRHSKSVPLLRKKKNNNM